MTTAWLHDDAGTVGQFFADDFIEITRSGRKLTKSDILHAVVSPYDAFDSNDF